MRSELKTHHLLSCSLQNDHVEERARVYQSLEELCLSDIKSSAPVLAGQANVPIVGAAVQNVPDKLPPDFQFSTQAGVKRWRDSTVTITGIKQQELCWTKILELNLLPIWANSPMTSLNMHQRMVRDLFCEIKSWRLKNNGTYKLYFHCFIFLTVVQLKLRVWHQVRSVRCH